VHPPIRTADADACPGALRLHAAADGPLARIRIPGGSLTGAQLALLGDLAARWGDGHLELTSRANLQLRALTRANTTDLAARLSAAGLLPSLSHELVRNIAAPPLAGPSLRALVQDLDRAICADAALAALPGRFLFAIGTVPLAADLAAIPAGQDFAILFAGHDCGLRVPPAAVIPALLAAAHAFLDARPAAPTPVWRLAELPTGPTPLATRTAAALGISTPHPTTPPADSADQKPLIGVVPQGDGLVAVGALVPLGRLTADHIEHLSRAERLVLTAGRGVLVPDLSPQDAASWLTTLREAGLPIEPESRWSGVTACAGRPGCPKSLADVRTAADATTRFVPGLPVHWIGCARGCGSPAVPHVRVEATPEGWKVTRPDDPVTAAPDGAAAAVPGELAEIVAAARRRV
jgi:precorrin-3B synthase